MNPQEKVKEFAKKNDLLAEPKVHALDLMAEVGEIAKEILKATNYGKKQFQTREEMKLELGDAYYSLLMLANACNVDLLESLNLVLVKYDKRLKKGGAGSEFE